MTGAIVIRADTRALPLPDACVDLIVTSPPYFGLRSYQDAGEHYDGQIGSEDSPAGWLAAMAAATVEWIRVLKPTGSMFVNLGDKYSDRAGPEWVGSSDRLTGRPPKPRRRSSTAMAPRKSLLGLPWRYALNCIDDLGLILRAEIIWDKPNALPESVADRVRRSHEQWFHLVKQPRYYAAIDDLRVRSVTADTDRRSSPARHEALVGSSYHDHHADDKTRGNRGVTVAFNPLGKIPGSVWTVPTEPLHVPEHLGIDHFAAFPTAWPKRLIQGWSPRQAVVLDPFGGTGTTALVAAALGRVGISVDLSQDYSRLARWRTTDRAQLAKVLELARPPVETIGQRDLFDD